MMGEPMEPKVMDDQRLSVSTLALLIPNSRSDARSHIPLRLAF